MASRSEEETGGEGFENVSSMHGPTVITHHA
jgi:hypothetical protein